MCISCYIKAIYSKPKIQVCMYRYRYVAVYYTLTNWAIRSYNPAGTIARYDSMLLMHARL